jgi:Zn-dependent protease
VDIGLLPILRDDPLTFVLLAVTLVWAIALHEYAHAFMADLQGDRMPRAMGRLTLNPARHLDPLGTVAIVLVGFGWGKPVEFRPQALSSQRFGAALVALAGPFMNLLLAFAGVVAIRVVLELGLRGGEGVIGRVLLGDFFSPGFLELFATINVLLAVFNLIPLPPLDGSRLLTIFLPPSKRHVLFFLDRYGFLILLALVFLGGIQFIDPVREAVLDVIVRIVGL